MTAPRAGQGFSALETIWSTVWRGVCGALLCYVSAAMIAIVVGSIALLIRDDFAYLKEAFCGLIGGFAGSQAGVWVLKHTLRRFPGRTIAWVYIATVVPLLLLQVVGVVWILVDPKEAPALGDFFSRNNAYFDFSSIGEMVGFYSLLIQPRVDFMKA